MAKEPQPPPGIPEYGKIEPTKGFDQENKLSIPDQQAFEQYMEEPISPSKMEESTAISPMQLKQKTELKSMPTTDSLVQQISTAQNSIKNTKELLNTKNLSFKPSQQRLLDSKLSQSFSNIQKAAKESNVTPSQLASIEKGPFSKFLNYLSNGENSLNQTKAKLQELQATNKQLKPSQLMLIQVNIAQAQQSIEFSSIVISKVVDTLKQMFNIQI